MNSNNNNILNVNDNIKSKFMDTKNFLNSNSPLAILSFFLLVLVIFFILLKISSALLTKLYEPRGNVTLIDGMIDSRHMVSIPQDPNNVNSIPVVRSKNEDGGLEFTWSVWLLIEDLVYKQNEYK